MSESATDSGIQKDIELTVRELSDTCEELSLFYKLSEVLSGIFDAMSSDRPYRRRKTRDEILDEIGALSGKQFDPKVVDAFRQWVTQQHPISSP